MQLSRGANNGINGTGGQAASAANAAARIDPNRFLSTKFAAVGIGCGYGTVKEFCESVQGGVATRWAAIDVSVAIGDSLGIRTTAVVAATPALRLGQQVVN